MIEKEKAFAELQRSVSPLLDHFDTWEQFCQALKLEKARKKEMENEGLAGATGLAVFSTALLWPIYGAEVTCWIVAILAVIGMIGLWWRGYSWKSKKLDD